MQTTITQHSSCRIITGQCQNVGNGSGLLMFWPQKCKESLSLLFVQILRGSLLFVQILHVLRCRIPCFLPNVIRCDFLLLPAIAAKHPKAVLEQISEGYGMKIFGAKTKNLKEGFGWKCITVFPQSACIHVENQNYSTS